MRHKLALRNILVIGVVILTILALFFLLKGSLLSRKPVISPSAIPTAIPTLSPTSSPAGLIYKDLCGDGICQEIVCLAEGCPCAETPLTCSQDCK